MRYVGEPKKVGAGGVGVVVEGLDEGEMADEDDTISSLTTALKASPAPSQSELVKIGVCMLVKSLVSNQSPHIRINPSLNLIVLAIRLVRNLKWAC